MISFGLCILGSLPLYEKNTVVVLYGHVFGDLIFFNIRILL